MIKKLLTYVFIAAMFILGGISIANADVTQTFWNQTSPNVLMTNTGNGLANADIHVANCYIGTGTGLPCGGVGGGITSINGDITAAQLITGGTGINVSTVAGNTTITNTAAGTITGSGAAPQVTIWSGATDITGSNMFYNSIFTRLGIGQAAPAFTLDVAGPINADGAYNTDGLFFGDQDQPNQSVSVGNNAHNVALGVRNTVFGNDAANNLTIGNDNTIIGQNAAGDAAWASNQNTAVGSSAGRLLSSGTRNVFMGYKAGDAIGAGNDNVFIGNEAGVLNTNASGNTAVGAFAMPASIAGANNTAIGANSLFATTGQNNTALGAAAGLTNTGGQQNVFIGALVNTIAPVGNDQVAIGYQASVENRGTAIGSNTSAGDSGIALGHTASAVSGEFALPNTLTNFKFQGDSYTLPTAFPASSGDVLSSTNAGVMTWITPSSGTIGGSIAATQVGYGSGVNTLTSDATFTRTPTNFTVQALNGGNTAELQVDANTPVINTFAANGTVTGTLNIDPGTSSSLIHTNGVISSAIDLDLTGSTLVYDDGAGNQAGIDAALGALTITNNDGVGNTQAWLWPTVDAQQGDVLTTDGNGTLTFAPGGSVDTSNAISVMVATTTILPGAPSYANGVSGVGATLTRTGNGAIGSIDGVALGLGDRLLVKNQVATLQNGVYEVTDAGSGGTPYILTRTTDSDEDVEFDDQVVVPTQGTTQANQIFGQTTQTPTIGTDPIVYVTVTNTYVTQSVTGTQSNTNIPTWTNNPRQQARGDIGLQAPSATWLNTQLRLGKTNQGGRIAFRSGTNVSNVFIGYNDATTANVFNTSNVSAGGELRNSIAGTTSMWTLYSNSGVRVILGDQGQIMAPYGVAAGETYRMVFRELAAGGTNFVGFKAPDAIAANVTWVLPNADSTGTQALVSNGSGILSWATAGSGNVTGSGTSPRIPYWSSASALTDDSSFTRLAGRGIQLQDDGTFQNVFIGTTTGVVGATGSSNVGVGVNTLNALTNGRHNIALGEDAGGNTADGIYNVTIGNFAGFETVSRQNSVYIGREAGRRMEADENIAIGYGAMFGSGVPASNTGQRNIAFGRDTLSALTSGQNNIAIGYGSGTSIANGAENIVIGQTTGASLVSTSGNTFIGNANSTTRTSGNNNTIIGAAAGGGVGTGATNAGLGYNAFPVLTSGGNNVAIGAGAGATLTTGSDNTLVGPSAAVATAGTSGAIALGYQATAAANEFALPNAITNWKFQGDSYTLPTAFPSSNDKALISSTAGVMTWGPTVSSGFYTPTLTGVSNVDGTTAYDAQWSRVGDVVTVGIRLEVDATLTATLTEVGISLPVASNIAGLEGVAGSCAATAAIVQAGGVAGDAANDRGQLGYMSSSTASQSMYCTFVYTVI